MSSQIVSVISLLIALVAVCIAAWQIRISTRLTVSSNSVPAIARVLDEWRSDVFRDHVTNLKKHTSDTPVQGGFEALPGEWRNSAYTVGYFFDYVGTLMLFKLIDDDIVIGQLSSQAVTIWQILEPHIISERQYREATNPPGASTGFLKFYEHMVAEIMDRGGADAAARVQDARGIRRLTKSLDPPMAPPTGV